MDELARSGHALYDVTEAPLPRQDKLCLAQSKLSQIWDFQWKSSIASSGKGRHLSLIKAVPSEWSWAYHPDRKIETSLARLRIGHVGLNFHLFRINVSPSPSCSCGQTETIEHFFFQCPLYAQARTILYDSLMSLPGFKVWQPRRQYGGLKTLCRQFGLIISLILLFFLI